MPSAEIHHLFPALVCWKGKDEKYGGMLQIMKKKEKKSACCVAGLWRKGVEIAYNIARHQSLVTLMVVVCICKLLSMKLVLLRLLWRR